MPHQIQPYQASEAHNRRLREGLANMILRCHIQANPILSQFGFNSDRVSKFRGGRHWLFRQPYTTGLGGSGHFVAMGGSPNALNPAGFYQNRALNQSTGWDGREYSTMPGDHEITMWLSEWKGNMHWSPQLSMSDALEANLEGEDMFTAVVKGAAQRYTLAEAMNFYAENVTSYALGTVGTITFSAGPSGTPNTRATITLNRGEIRRGMEVGIMLDFYRTATASSSSSSSSSGEAQKVNETFDTIIDDLDPFARQITIAAFDGTTPLTGIQAGDEICLRASRTFGPFGLRNFIKTGSGPGDYYILDDSTYGLDVRNFSQHKSYVRNVGAVLSEDLWLRIIGAWIKATAGTDREVDTFAFDPDVMTAIAVRMAANQATNRYFTFERNRQKLGIVYGHDHIEFTFQGKTYRIYEDSNVTAGVGYGLQLRNGNWQRKVPPRARGTGTHPAWPSRVQFHAPFAGRTGIWMEDRNSDGGVEETVGAPHTIYQQFVAKRFGMLMLTNCTTRTDLPAGSPVAA